MIKLIQSSFWLSLLISELCLSILFIILSISRMPLRIGLNSIGAGLFIVVVVTLCNIASKSVYLARCLPGYSKNIIIIGVSLFSIAILVVLIMSILFVAGIFIKVLFIFFSSIIIFIRLVRCPNIMRLLRHWNLLL